MTSGGLFYSQSPKLTATAPQYSIPPASPPSSPPMHFTAATWWWIVTIAVLSILAILGGGAWLHNNLDGRIDRFEGRYDAAQLEALRTQNETNRTLADIRVQLATISSRNPSKTDTR